MFSLKTNSEMYGPDTISGYATLESVSAGYSEIRDFTDEGASTFAAGIVLDESGKHVYTISFNGRVWAADGETLIQEASVLA